ncbi:hypothetical protein BOA8489_03962 [Boseongicola aestuarii]|uniref:Uncharacterized protein n=1 Tax=Boseongicola aestuarii TaxID=1470561 RepID=A0A238J5E3_9RHOB|nr:hypothetical protein BOA8489_03962 [Boseongicola aestuarii]
MASKNLTVLTALIIGLSLSGPVFAGNHSSTPAASAADARSGNADSAPQGGADTGTSASESASDAGSRNSNGVSDSGASNSDGASGDGLEAACSKVAAQAAAALDC